jgi:hypothetical protein
MKSARFVHGHDRATGYSGKQQAIAAGEFERLRKPTGPVNAGHFGLRLEREHANE